MITIRRLIDLEAEGHGSAALIAAIATIFRATAAKWPDDAVVAHAFQSLWLDQYLTHERDLVYLAVDDRGGGSALHVAGYLLKPVTFQTFVELMVTLNRYWQLVEYP